MMSGYKNKFKNSASSSKEAKKKKRNNEESSSSPRAVVKRAENRLSLILKRGMKTDHGNHYAKSDNRSAIYPFYKRPRNNMNSKFARNQKEKKKRFSPRITSTLRCDQNMSAVSDKAFYNSFSVLRVQSNYNKTPDVDDVPVGSSANNSVLVGSFAGNSFLKSTKEAVNTELSTSNRRADKKSPTRVVNYQSFAAKIKTSLLEASDRFSRNNKVNLKTKLTNLLIETYNKSNNNNSKIQNFRITPSLENLKVSPAVTEFNNSDKSPYLNHLQSCKGTAVSSSSSSALTPHFDPIPDSENTACQTLIINPVKFLKKYDQGVSKETESCGASCPPQSLLLTPHSSNNTKVFSALTPKSAVVNPFSYMKQYDLLSQNYENEKYASKIERNVKQKGNQVPCCDQSANVKDFNFIFNNDTVFPSSSVFYKFDNADSHLISTDNSAYNNNYHSLIPQYRKPEEHLTYNPRIQPIFNNISEPTNPPQFRNWSYDEAPGRCENRQPSRIPQDNFIFNNQNQLSKFQSMNNWRLSVPLQIKPPENTIFPLSGGAEFEIDIPPDFELKIF